MYTSSLLPQALRSATALLTAALLAGCAAPLATTGLTFAAPEAILQPAPALRIEGIPPLPQRLMDDLQRYTRVAGHGLVDWHPTRPEMLVTHRPPQASTTQLYLVSGPMAALEPLTDSPEPVSNASWEPREGRYIVFARGTGGDEAYQLYRLDPTSKQATPFTEPGQRHALQGWIKAQSLAIVSSVPLDRTAQGGSRTQISTTLSVVDPLNPVSRRVVAELPGGGWFGAEASPDGRQLAITQYASATSSSIWLIDLASGQRRRVLPVDAQAPKASHFVTGWTHDGASLLLTSDSASEFRELMRFDLASGQLHRLTARIPWDLADGDLSPDGRWLAITVNADGRDELRLLDPQQGQARPLPALPAGSISQPRFHPTRGELAFVVNSAQGPAQVHTLDLTSGRITPWTQPVKPAELDLSQLPEQQVVRWTSFDGRTISGILSLPPTRFAGKRPVVMVMHGGPESQSKLGWQGRQNYLLQELGVAVLEPNVRGSTGYGKTFLSLDDGRLREDSVKDMGTAIDWIATQRRLDASRVLVSGGSYGGYMALAASTRLTERIAGAMSTVGISNFVTFLERTESYRRDLRRVEYGDEREPAMRAFLEGISPLNHVDKISKPLFVVQGKNDPRVPWTESEQIVRSLQARGLPVWYLLADNEGHGFARRENADYYFAAYVRFVEQTLKP